MTYVDVQGNRGRWRSGRLRRKRSKVQPNKFLNMLKFKAERVFIKKRVEKRSGRGG